MPYRKIAEEFEKSGYKRTFTQCREKIKALKKKHKEVVGLPILKFRFHSASSQPDTTLQKNIRLLGLAHIILFLTHAPQQQTPGHNSRDLLRKSAIRLLEVSALWRASPLIRTRLFRIQYKAKHRKRIAASFAVIERGTYPLLRKKLI